MIPYRLKEDKYKNHPMDGRYGTVITNTPYANYPVTIVDNHEEVVDGKYTKKPILCLLHLSEDVRTYTQLRLFDEFLYISFAFSKPTFHMFEYKKVKLSTVEIIKILKNVFYFLQPNLQNRSLVGTIKKGIENDPNYYEGHYVLNDEEEYTILKCKSTYKFFKGKKAYYPNWSDTEDLIFEGEINFDIYKLSLELARLKAFIVTHTNELLEDDSNDSISQYQTLKKQLKEQINQEVL